MLSFTSMTPRSFTLLLACLGALAASGCARSSILSSQDDAGLGGEDADVGDDAGPDDAGPDEEDAAIALPDAGPAEEDAGPPDAGPMDAGLPDAGPMDAGPPPECTLVGMEDPACDDGDACTIDTCDDAMECAYENPNATCERFAGGQCAEDALRDALTQSVGFCVPSFELFGIGLCVGETCDDGSAGCQLGFGTSVDSVSYVREPEEVFSFVAHFEQPTPLRIAGEFPLIDGLPPVAVDCFVGIDFGEGATATAELALDRPPMCSSDRPLMASVDVSLEDLSLSVRGTGGLSGLTCGLLEVVLAGVLDPATLVGPVEPTLEGLIVGGLEFLDCGACDYDCLGALVCTVPGLPVP